MTHSSFLIVGKHAVIEALKNPNRKILKIFLTEESKKIIHRENPNKNLIKGIKIFYKTKKEIDNYCRNEDILHQGFAAEIEQLEQQDLKVFIKERKNLTLVCLDNVNDPRNIGSVIRSAASFDIDGIIVKERHFPEKSKLMYKSASGCMEHVNIFKVSNINTTLKYLRDNSFWVYAFDGKGESDFTKIDWKGKNVLIFGSEGSGIKKHTEKYADFNVKIIINKKVESLNISNSASIVFHHIKKKKIS